MAFADIADTELIYLIRSNNLDAKSYLINRYKKRIYGMINDLSSGFPKFSVNYDDCYQDCFIVLLKCIDLFNLDYNFYNYFKGAMIRDFKRQRKSDKENNAYMPLCIYSDTDKDIIDSVSEDDGKYNDVIIEKYIDTNFGKLEQEIIRYKIAGYDAGDIAQLVGVSKKIVYKSIVRIRKIMLNSEI